MTEQLNQDIRRLIDGELEPAAVSRVLRGAAEDADARDLLCMEFRMRRSFEEQREAAWAVPDGFSDRVMKEVYQRSAEAASDSSIFSRVGSWIEDGIDRLITARPVMLRPAYGLAVVLILAIGVLLFRNGQVAYIDDPESIDGTAVQQVAGSVTDNVLVPFVYVDGDASSVAVAGDFNGWEPTSLQRKNIDGRVVWTGLVPVSRGEHRYMFVIDGSRWESDPLAPVHRDDGFGNNNAILAL